jgi:hypothetical protein
VAYLSDEISRAIQLFERRYKQYTAMENPDYF